MPADLDGRVLHVKSDLASVRAQIYEALVLPDGSFWLVASGPYHLSNNFGGSIGSWPSAPFFNQLDRYSPTGAHLSAVRLPAPTGASESPIGAVGDLLVLRDALGVNKTSRQSEPIRFGSAAGGQFKESTLVRLAPPVLGAIPVLTSNGNLLLIDKTSGSVSTK